MLRVKVFLSCLLAALVAGVWFLWAAGVSEPPVAVADAVDGASAPVAQVMQVGAAPAAAWPASPSPRRVPLPSDMGVAWPDLTRRALAAIAEGSPESALVAANLIERCASADRRVSELFALRDTQAVKPAAVAAVLAAFNADERKLIEQAQQEQRHCQGLDAQTRAQQLSLLQRAFEARVEGAAMSYSRWLENSGHLGDDAALLASLRERVRSDADAGDMGSVLSLAWNGDGERYALEPQAQQAYRLALKRIHAAELGNAGWLARPVGLLMDLAAGEMSPLSLSPAELQAAEQHAQRIVDSYKRRPPTRKNGVG